MRWNKNFVKTNKTLRESETLGSLPSCPFYTKIGAIRSFLTVSLIRESQDKTGFDHGRSEMKLMLFAKPLFLLGFALSSTILFLHFCQPNQPSSKADLMARSFVLWLHGLGDSGPANEPIKTLFNSTEFRNTVWSFPSAPSNPVTCNCKSLNLKFYGRLYLFEGYLISTRFAFWYVWFCLWFWFELV